MTVEREAEGQGIADVVSQSTWFRLAAARGQSGWDEAHRLFSPGRGLAAIATDIQTVEPDWEQAWPTEDRPQLGAPLAAKADVCEYDPQDPDGGRAVGPSVAWPFDDQYSQLAKARARVGDAQSKVLVAHLDTGFDPDHITKPQRLELAQQRNFIAGQNPNDAVDRTPVNGGPLTNRGHGPATLALLAGNRLDGTSPDWPGFTEYVGGAPLARVVPVRIANGVVEFSTSTMVQGFNYARSIGAHVLSMSMGGLSSDMLVDAINDAYDAGVAMVTAAGNSYSMLGPITTVVFPARYRRVVAACGVMADGRSYSGLAPGMMQGNYGPPTKMLTTIGAYTPNAPWAQIGCPKVVDMNGSGTSSSTPQVAAAMALWLAYHWDVLQGYAPWARIEAARFALFKSARKTTSMMSAAEVLEKLGQGALRADDALNVPPPPQASLTKLPPAQSSWAWLDYLTDGGVSLGRRSLPNGRLAMLKLELTQMAQRFPQIEKAVNDPDVDKELVPVDARNRYLEAALDVGQPSAPLRQFLEGLLGKKTQAPGAAVDAKPVKREIKRPPIPPRRLRVYALDPSLGQSNEFYAFNETTLSVPWDDVEETPETAKVNAADKSKARKQRTVDTREPLKPGPVGEYLEVVDVDPASNKVYDPVDLNDKILLAQDGWAPSEGNPQFHQQMVYAVAMTTIGHFERALGRKALWAPRQLASGRQEPVRRLRIYPHALRAQNAYYSPEKKALLFGYFTASEEIDGLVAPGSMVFTCLSSDIIAHETSHALLDGLHRRFTEASNPDVPAFHEAFADIVAIFQHFTFRDLVRYAISRAGGDLSAANILGGLALQFGQGSGRKGPLRGYNDKTEDGKDYATTKEAHDRGSILVFAVYDAFLKIVARRTADLVRLATNGTNVLVPGALHPDLVERLTEETCETASDLLHICIRALDYCPAVDITFGEYLRGLITADVDVRPADRHGYRVALIEAFRNRRILPRDVRTVSEDSLTWNTFVDPTDGSWLREMLRTLDLSWNLDLDRSEVIGINEANRWKAWSALNRTFASHPELMPQFGLQPGLSRFDEQGKKIPSRNVTGRTTFDLFSLRPTRRVAEDGSFRTEVIATLQQRQPMPLYEGAPPEEFFWFRGGATVIIDPRRGHEAIRYSIVKNSTSRSRQQRQTAFAATNSLSPLRGLYFGGEVAEPFALMHAKMGDEQ